MEMATRRSLWPREHGAYAQLAAPILTALLLRMPTMPAVLLAIAACAAFLANEPLLVVLGHRGPRVRAAEGARARRRLLALGAVALAFAVLGLARADLDTIRMAAIAALPTSVLLFLAWRRAQHSLLGELAAAIALPAASAPIAVASGISSHTASLLWLAWSIGYAASVLAVHRVIARHRRAATWIDRVIVLALGAALAVVFVAGMEIPLLLSALPLVALSGGLVVWPPRANHLRAIGVALVAASAAAIGIAVVVL